MQSTMSLKASLPLAFFAGGIIAVLAILSHYWVERNRQEAATTAAGPTISTSVPAVRATPGPKPATNTAKPEKHAMPLDQRPYVFPEVVEFTDNDTMLQSSFFNSGKTPAVDLGLAVRYIIFSGGTFDMNAAKPSDISQPSGYGNVPAGMRIVNKISSHNLDHPSEFELMKQGKLQCYVFGFLVYKDLDGRGYEPRFCFKWVSEYGKFMRCEKNAFVEGQKL